MDRDKRRTLGLLRKHGAKLVRHKKHKIYRLPDGRNFVESSTPSDVNAYKNGYHTLIRLLRNPCEGIERIAKSSYDSVKGVTGGQMLIVPNNPPRGKRGRVDLSIPPESGEGVKENSIISDCDRDLQPDFDIDLLLDIARNLHSYRELTPCGKAQVLIKQLRKYLLRLRVVTTVKLTDFTEAERNYLAATQDVPLSCCDRSRCSIFPMVLVRKGGVLDVPQFELAIEVEGPETIGILLHDVPLTTFPVGPVAYTVVSDGSIEFSKDLQWYSHPSVRLVLREIAKRADIKNGFRFG